jgi:hypothetical protein
LLLLALRASGLAYAICCDVLDSSTVARLVPVSKQPGDSISCKALKKLAAAAVASPSGKQQPLAQLASSLLLAPSECISVMPSLLGMMLTGPIAPAGKKVQPSLSLLCTLGILSEESERDLRAVLQGGGDLDGDSAGRNQLLQSVAELLIAAFSKQPVLDLQQPATQHVFKALCFT